ncbi:8063_t:CDS:2 [Diversispora eburnea]|uniref:8063_t:CDS:1 n=1 Tax=Diversispora eburnea TaxID=1213867 RepID=A0A9N9ARF2_9GLOM|nr:8063_t:CDS:2 [Diversispora eburnea]
MPKGYPESVTKDYWEFTKWQLIQNISGSLTGVLSTQSLLFAMGLGNKSIPMAAALNWIIKDGLGQFGGVIYAAFINNRFDSEPKRHRFQSIVAMQLAALLELFTPLFPGMFLFIASISNIGKNIAWLAGSATRAQINKTFALRTALGVILSATMTSIPFSFIPNIEQLSVFLSSPMTPIFLSFIPISIFSIYCNYRSNLYITTNTLNIPRTEMILHDVLNGYYSSKDYLSKNNSYKEGKEEEISEPPPLDLQQQQPIINKFKNLIATPRNISTREIFVKKYLSPFKIPLTIEPDLDNYIILKELQQKQENLYKNKNNYYYEINLYNCLKQIGFLCPEEYYIFTHTTTNNNNIANTNTTINTHPFSHISENNSSQQNKKHHVAIWFSQNAKSKDIIKGFYHACVIRYILEHEKSLVNSLSKDSNSQNYDDNLNIIRKTHEWVNNSFDIFLNELVEKRWDIEHHFLENISYSKVDGNRLLVEFNLQINSKAKEENRGMAMVLS